MKQKFTLTKSRRKSSRMGRRHFATMTTDLMLLAVVTSSAAQDPEPVTASSDPARGKRLTWDQIVR